MAIIESDTLLTLAKTVWGEARGETWLGQVAVAWTIRTRAAHPGWWGHDIASCCRQPWQYSCWNAKDPNRAQLDRLTLRDAPAFRQCLAAAAAVLCDLEPDPTGGADHYLNLDALARPPAWYDPAKVTVRLGRHTFLKLG
jgi:spore germination cell wall hydrolase CwlJ-like protein